MDAQGLVNSINLAALITIIFSMGLWLKALFVLAVNSGPRQGELFGLQWRGVDLTEKQVRVRHPLEELDGKLRLKDPKSEKSRRMVELPTSAAEALARHRKRMHAEGNYGPNQPVFCDSGGT